MLIIKTEGDDTMITIPRSTGIRAEKGWGGKFDVFLDEKGNEWRLGSIHSLVGNEVCVSILKPGEYTLHAEIILVLEEEAVVLPDGKFEYGTLVEFRSVHTSADQLS